MMAASVFIEYKIKYKKKVLYSVLQLSYVEYKLMSMKYLRFVDFLWKIRYHVNTWRGFSRA
ncbi:hypothetical protein B5E84_01500 [Lachnoclostridium sp. An14]|nr:hypothetical protein B5E84_01500 [Lachnoclostridium sp. An14]